MKAKLLAFGLLTLVAAYGCAGSTSDDETPPNDGQSEDELQFVKGSVDNAAIVEVGTMMLASGPTSGLLDPYNQEEPFAVRPGNYTQTFRQRLAMFDNTDGHVDWNAEQTSTWATRISTGNYQVLDLSKPCDFYNPHTYLEIERAQMTGREHTTCGGRNPNEDALDVTLNFLVRGPAASVSDQNALHDGVDHATKPATDTFPYLGEMNGL